MFSRSQSKKQSAENDLIAANRLLAQLKRELNFNINQLEVMPVAQAWSPFAVHRDS